jgi:cephalosporin hydroxylase
VEEYPIELRKRCGAGLKSWQYPNQFSKYLVYLSQYKIESYMEIGVRHGGTFIITIEYLNKFHPIKKALAVDIGECPMVVDYHKDFNENADFWRIDSQSFKFEGFARHCNGIDLIMIDADHGFPSVNRDFHNAQKMGRMIALHDISNDACPGVRKVWDAAAGDKNRYKSQEFMEQYDCFIKQQKKFFGIGLLEDLVLPVEKHTEEDNG